MRSSAPPSRSSAAGPLLTGGRSGGGGYASQQRYGSSTVAASNYDETAPAPVAAPALPAPILAPSPTRARAVVGAGGGSFRAPQAAGSGAGAALATASEGGGSLLNVVPADAGYAAAASRRLGAHATRSMRLSSGQGLGLMDGYDDTAAPSVLSPAKHAHAVSGGSSGPGYGSPPLMAVAMDSPAKSAAGLAGRSQLASSGAALARQESQAGRFDAASAGGGASSGSPQPPRTPGALAGTTGSSIGAAAATRSDMEVLMATMGTRPRGYADAHSRAVHLQATHPGALAGPPVSPLTAGGHAAVSPPSRGALAAMMNR